MAGTVERNNLLAIIVDTYKVTILAFESSPNHPVNAKKLVTGGIWIILMVSDEHKHEFALVDDRKDIVYHRCFRL
jgi:hypothetical protein